MDVVYTNQYKTEEGVLKDYDIDYDTIDKKDFVIAVGTNNNVLTGGSIWYINDTEYGGIVDDIEVITSSSTIQYSGRNFRGILCSKYIMPPVGMDYRTVQGNIADITNELIRECGIQQLFHAVSGNVNISGYSFERYVSLYDGLVKMAYQAGKIIRLNVCNGVVYITYEDRIDYSEEMEYCQDDIAFKIKKSFCNVNHLICLGKGELQARQVVHLYVDGDGDIVEQPYYRGIDEYCSVYENSSADTVEKLREEGANKLGELMNGDSFEVSAPDKDLHIGDIIGGYEKITGFRVRREIVNIIATITEEGIDIAYSVGGDEPGAAGIPSDVIEEYILPIATKQVLGGIKVGDNFNINDGRLECEPIQLLNIAVTKAELICT